MLETILMFLGQYASEYIFFVMFHVSMQLPIHHKKIILTTMVVTLCGTLLFQPVNLFCMFLVQELHISSLLLTSVMNAFLNIPALYYLSLKQWKLALFHGACCYFVWQTLVFLESGILYAVLLDPSHHSSTLLISLLSLYPFYKFGIWLIKKIHPAIFAQYLQLEKRSLGAVCGISFCILLSLFLIDMLHFIENFTVFYYFFMFLTLIAISSVVCRITSDYAHRQEKETMNELLISQQTLYIQNLEDIQSDMRMFQHDYLNMLSSIYLDITQGDVQNIQQTITTLLHDFDASIGQKMNGTTQLANIKITELKSLIIKKLTMIHQTDIQFELEVLYPVEHVAMNISDFIRCVGILIDNAIEETMSDNGSVSLSILQGEEFVIVIENSVHHAMEMDAIWRKGYSTKGTNRGIGLSSYQTILDQYDNVTTSTMYEQNTFIQELRIGVKP